MNIPLLKKQEEKNLAAVGGQARKAASHFMSLGNIFFSSGWKGESKSILQAYNTLEKCSVRRKYEPWRLATGKSSLTHGNITVFLEVNQI